MKQNITPNKRKRNPFFSIVDLYYKKIVLNYYYYTLVTLVNKNLMEIVLITYIKYLMTFLVAQMVKNLPAMRERTMWVQSQGWKIPGGAYGNPLQCSCLENPRDREPWWTAAHGVTELDTAE